MSRGAACPDEPPTEANQYQTRCTASGPTPIQPDGTSGRASSPDVQKSPAWCMIRAKAKRAPAEKTVLAEPALVIEASAARDEKR